MAPVLQGEFKTLAALSQSRAYTGLDYVGVGIYKDLLRKVPGMKIGHVLNGKVVWE